MTTHSDTRTDADNENVEDRVASAIKSWLTRDDSPFPDYAQDQCRPDTRLPLRIDRERPDLVNLTSVHEETWIDLQSLSEAEQGYCFGRVHSAIGWLQNCRVYHGGHSRIAQGIQREIQSLRTTLLLLGSQLAKEPVSAAISHFDFELEQDLDLDEWSAFREELDTGEADWAPDQYISPIVAFEKWFASPLTQTTELAMELGWLMDRGLRPLYRQADANTPWRDNSKFVPNQIRTPSQNPSTVRSDETWVQLMRETKSQLASALKNASDLRFLPVPQELSIESLDTFDRAIRVALRETTHLGILLNPKLFSINWDGKTVRLKESRFRMVEILVENRGSVSKESFLNCYKEHYPQPKKDAANSLNNLVIQLNTGIAPLELEIRAEGYHWKLAPLRDANVT